MDKITSTLFSLSKSLTNTKSIKPVQILHQKAIIFGLKNNIALCKNLINLYISCSAHQTAGLVFQNIENPLDITLWNGLMSAYAKNYMYCEVIALFDTLLRFPHLKPNSHTYPSALKACAGLKRVRYGEKIHARVVKTGSLSDVVIASSVVGMYAKCGAFESALNVFDEMPEKDLACWNNMISCYYQSGQSEKALKYFEMMKSTGLRPDSVSFTTAISSCGRLLDLEKGIRIHEEVLRSGLLMDSYVSATLVDMYGKCGSLERARQVFDEIKEKSLVSWNSMIGGYSQIGDTMSCIRLLSSMNSEKVRPSSTTISSLLAACAKSAQLRNGKFLHGYILRNNIYGDTHVDISLLDMYFKCSNVLLAKNVFKLMPKSDIIAWNVMISGYVSSGFYFEALEAYDRMREQGKTPDGITFTSALAACSQLAALERGKELHEFISKCELSSNEVLTGALLDMYAKCGAVQEAEDVFNRLPSRDLVSWTSMIVAYGSNGRALEALKLFNDMLKACVRPDRVTFLAVISACSHGGLVKEGQHYFHMMVKDYRIEPTIAEYSSLIDLLARAGRLREAYDILQKNCKIKEDIELLSTLFAACHLHGDVDLGEKIVNSLIEKNPDDPSTYVVLEKLCAGSKKWDEARRIRSKIKEMGLKKNPGLSWIEVHKSLRSFLAEDRMFAEAESVYDCLCLLYGHMEDREEVALEAV